VHRETCANVADYRKQPDKWLPVTWQNKPGRLFLAEIRIDIVNRMGMLAALSAAIAATNTNVNHVTIDQRDSETQVLIFIVEVSDREHLARIMRILRRMPDVLRVVRAIASNGQEQSAELQGDASDDAGDDLGDARGDHAQQA
jgi:(p)ppGpp synthase/HD superfamily hydrolase